MTEATSKIIGFVAVQKLRKFVSDNPGLLRFDAKERGMTLSGDEIRELTIILMKSITPGMKKKDVPIRIRKLTKKFLNKKEKAIRQAASSSKPDESRPPSSN